MSKIQNLKDHIDIIESGTRGKGGAISFGIPSLGGEHINRYGGFNLNEDKMKYISEELYTKMKSGKIKAHDVLVVKDGATTGKVSYVNDDFPLRQAAINEHVFILRPKDSLISKYLFYFLYSKTGQTKILEDFRGATIGGISKNFINMPITIPDIITQNKIIRVLDYVSIILNFKKQQIKELDNLIKSYFIEMFGNPIKNDRGWEIKKINEIFNVTSSKRIYQREQTAFGIPFLRISDLVKRIEKGTNDCTLFISPEQYEEFKNKSLVPLGDDILVTSRGTLGLCYIIKKTDCFYFQDGMISWLQKGKLEVNSIFISYSFKMEGLRRQISKIPTGSTVNYLSISQLAELEVMYPPIELQNQFAAFVKTIDNLKTETQKSITETQTLMNSLMQKYFG